MSAAEEAFPASAVRTARVDYPDGTHRHVAWCPWCEALHRHGEGAGARTAHCHEEAASPFSATGYDLAVVVEAKRGDDVMLAALVGHRPSLHRKLDRGAKRLRSELAASVLGVPKTKAFRQSEIAKGVRGATIGASWYVGRDGEEVTGKDLVALAELLHGLPAGVVSVRMLEAATGLDLDARAATELAGVIDAWVERGRPRGRMAGAGRFKPAPKTRDHHPKSPRQDWL